MARRGPILHYKNAIEIIVAGLGVVPDRQLASASCRGLLLLGSLLTLFVLTVGPLSSAAMIMKFIAEPILTWGAFSLSMGAAICGGRSAWLWYRASKVKVSPAWVKNGSVEPGDPGLGRAQWIAALLAAAQESATLNAKAACWTAAAVALTGFAAIATTTVALLAK